ncbi:MAG TPA: ectonucleotide pyrophosphatase/phosphodiesterase [Vicinamibacterales bacterium]
MSLARRSFIGVVLTALLACNAPAVLPPEKAILILISIDGFRSDYFDRFHPPALTTLAARGVRAEGLIPQFPSKTFPNHYTIVTGLTLPHHGIVSNNMRAPDIPGDFAMSNREVLADPRWWGGEPIWNTAEKQGRRAAAMFWPGSETVIGGRQATYWTPFDDRMPHGERVNGVLGWLRLPENERPSFLTLYFSDVDSAGHSRGPDSDDVRDAVMKVDRSIGQLVEGVKQIGLADRVHYVVVSDHGMAAVSPDRMILIDDYIDVTTADVIDWAPVLALSPKDGDVDKLYNALKGKHPALDVYRNSEIPAEYGLAGNPRVPAVFAIAREGWLPTSKRELQRWGEPDRHAPGGQHGYDPRAKSMQGLFIASGPRIRTAVIVKAFQNIHIYDFMCAVLGLQPAKNDGDPAVTRDMLR